MDSLSPPREDGFPYVEVGAWAEDKYKLVLLYDSLFSTGMKNKWNSRIYIDLYSGPGVAKVKDTNRMLWGSPLLALQVRDPFDKYIFCESNPLYLDGLKKRVASLSAQRGDISFIAGDCNDRVEEICVQIPRFSQSHRVLSFCFVDPYDLSIRFSTIRRLSQTFVDFLVLLALHMDANRNEGTYTSPGNTKLDEFLGQSDWRKRWAEHAVGVNFPRFIAEEYAKQMETLGYLPVHFHQMKQVRSDVKNLPLYSLALFSRNALAYEYWGDVLKYSTSQASLDWDR